MECYLLSLNVHNEGWLYRSQFRHSTHRYEEMVLKVILQSGVTFQSGMPMQSIRMSMWNYLFQSLVNMVNSDRSVLLMLVIVYVLMM